MPNIQHLPGVIEMDVLDSYKMLCRRLERVAVHSQDNNYSKSITISRDKTHSPRYQTS
jgi:hypothetical protein